MFGKKRLPSEEVPTGTHGLFSHRDCADEKLVGSLVVEDVGGVVMEMWNWKSGFNFWKVTPFFLKCKSKHTISSPPFKYHYKHKDLPKTTDPKQPLLMDMELDDDKWRLWKLTRGITATTTGADIGYFRLDLPRDCSVPRTGLSNYTSHWFIDPQQVSDNDLLIPLDDGEILRFERPSQNGSGKWRYLPVTADQYPGSGNEG